MLLWSWRQKYSSVARVPHHPAAALGGLRLEKTFAHASSDSPTMLAAQHAFRATPQSVICWVQVMQQAFPATRMFVLRFTKREYLRIPGVQHGLDTPDLQVIAWTTARVACQIANVGSIIDQKTYDIYVVFDTIESGTLAVLT